MSFGAQVIPKMIPRLRNYILLLLAFIAVWLLQPRVDAFLQQRGWDQVVKRTVDNMPTWNWWTTTGLPRLSAFWVGAFAVLVIWGTFEFYYFLRRRRARRLTTIHSALLEGLDCAYVHFLPETGEIMDSFNITSVGDSGRGDYRFTLAKPLDPKRLSVYSLYGSPMPAEWSASPAGDAIQVIYKTQPEFIRLRFDSEPATEATDEGRAAQREGPPRTSGRMRRDDARKASVTEETEPETQL
jgi:hypothetical protein